MAAPDWVSYVALGVSAVAVSISTLTFWRVRPKVNLDVIIPRYAPDGTVKVQLFNPSHSEYGITKIWFDMPMKFSPYSIVVENSALISGSLPSRVPALGESEIWIFKPLQVLSRHQDEIRSTERAYKDAQSWAARIGHMFGFFLNYRLCVLYGGGRIKRTYRLKFLKEMAKNNPDMTLIQHTRP